MPVKTAYRVLEIPENAPADEIKNAYRIMALKWHPDRHHNSHDKDAATRQFLEVTNAYRTLVREGRVNSPVAQTHRDPSPRRPRRPPTPMVRKNSSESSGSDDSFVHMVRSASVDTLPTPASSKRESLRASWGKNKGTRVPAADPMPGPSRGDASARQPHGFSYQPPPLRGAGKGPPLYAPPPPPFAQAPPVPPQPLPKSAGRAPPASSRPPPTPYPTPASKPNPRQPINNPPPTNARPSTNVHPPANSRPPNNLNPPTNPSRPPNNTRPPNNLQPPTNPGRPSNTVYPPNHAQPPNNLRRSVDPHPRMNPHPPMNPMNPNPPMNSRPPVNLRTPLNPNPPVNGHPPMNARPAMNPRLPVNPHPPMNAHPPMNQHPPLNSHTPMNANNRPPGQDSYKHVHTPHMPPLNSHNPRNQKQASPYEIPLTSIGPGPSGEWAYSLPLTLEDIFHGKHFRFGITRAYLSAKTKHVVIEIDIPAGCRAGTPIFCRNVGNERQPGVFQDIAFVIEEVPHECFVRVQDDLVMNVRLPWVEGLRRDGGKVPFTGIDGKNLGFQIDFQRDRVMKGRNVIKGAGMPVRDRGQVVGRGNLIIQWEILSPQPKMMHFMRRLWGGK